MPLDITVLAGVREATPNTRANPALATDAYIVTGQFLPKPVEGQLLNRGIETGFAGARPAVLTKTVQRLAFAIEMAGSGTATTAPRYMNLLRACLFAAPSVGATEVTQPLSSAGDGDSFSFDAWKDNVRHRSFGARGNAVMTFEEGGLPRIDFDFLAQISGGAPADGNTPGAVTLPAYPPPLEVNNANTVVQLDTFTLGLKSISIDMGLSPGLYATTAQRSIVYDRTEERDRRGINGTALFELPDPSVKSYFSQLINQTGMAFSLIHGATAGNIIDIASPNFVLRDITYQEERTRILASCPFVMIPTAANNEMVLKTR